jgi:hypothetical protein
MFSAFWVSQVQHFIGHLASQSQEKPYNSLENTEIPNSLHITGDDVSRTTKGIDMNNGIKGNSGTQSLLQ